MVRMRYCRVLEEESFRNKPADFLYMLMFGALIMLILGPVFRASFLSASLTFMIVYVWARRNPMVMMNFLGIFNFTAPFMPWVLLGFSLILSGHLPVADLIGILAGHCYYYFKDVFPLLFGWSPLATPSLLSDLLNPRPEAELIPQEDIDENELTLPEVENINESKNNEISIDGDDNAAGTSTSIRHRNPQMATSENVDDEQIS